jgi:hypothetical protein
VAGAGLIALLMPAFVRYRVGDQVFAPDDRSGCPEVETPRAQLIDPAATF